jgi:Response regulator receiver domain
MADTPPLTMTAFTSPTLSMIPSNNLKNCSIVHTFQTSPKSDCQHWGSAAMTPTEAPLFHFRACERAIVHKFLLVDDDDAVRDTMTVTLLHKGCWVVAAANVAEALKLITTETFDVIMTDSHMPNPCPLELLPTNKSQELVTSVQSQN